MGARIRLSWKEKYGIVKECRRRNVNSGTRNVLDISEWAQRTLKLKKAPSYRCIQGIIRDAERIEMKAKTSHSHMKADLMVSSTKIENILVQFVWYCSNNNVFITNEVIMEKARGTQTALNQVITNENRTFFTFSDGWIEKFKERNDFKCYKSHGESSDADFTAIRKELPLLQTLLSAFNPHNMFNADEFGLCYKEAPKSTIGPKRFPGFKKKKERFTFLSCVNVEGGERVVPVVIGKSKKPRCFNGRTGDAHGIYWRWNKKSCMTKALFFEWLDRFNFYIAQHPNRRAILLLDNASVHGDIETLPPLSNVLVLFLPKNTTAVLQPCDAGVIACVRRRFRQRKIDRAVDLIELGVKENLYDCDVLTGMKTIYSIFERLESEIIKKCWAKTGLLEREESEIIEIEES